MGVCMTSKYKGAKSLDGGYRMMFVIRREIAKAFDYEFGEHYSTLLDGFGEEHFKAFDEKTDKILSHPRFEDADVDLIEFFFMSDCDGKISYKTCGKIYDLIKDREYNGCLRYIAHSNNDWQDFKDLVKGCYSHRANLIWY